MPNEAYGFTYPVATSLADFPTDLKAALDSIGPRSNNVFASTAARDAAITAPDEGMCHWITALASQTLRTSTGWVKYNARYIAAQGSCVQWGASYVGWDNSVVTTDGSGQFNLGGTLATNFTGYLTTELSFATVMNGDDVARSNIVTVCMTTGLPLSTPYTMTHKCFIGNTGAALASVTFRAISICTFK